MKMIKPKMVHPVWGIAILTLILLVILGWKIYQKGVPTKVKSITDGSTIILANGQKVGLLGVSITKGSEKDHLIRQYLRVLLDSRNIWLEYKNNLAKVWVGCESTPKFWLFRDGNNKPLGCFKGVLVNEQIAKIELKEL